ncbi:hypothetical protein PC9H_004095 [Pleurotus ostreatus]|uniref:tRNA (cytosine(38)-C(5))-methyltransferase n=1 Tax=Pleurotus ostreatus TaxID=5322 RepID=A0A8H7DX31_PLEOS|nr:uncharacterized protein PC9H_004095 [Pleurotus ostreatus]KAF7437258.1 hypothetical protein PC9H_004095 [Pleurotus ostreatus]
MAIVAWEFYSGIGGLHLALQRSTIDGNVVRAFDWDQTACKVYSANHGPNVVQKTILPELVKLGTGVHPTRLLIENVAGFEFGIPNSRLRYYLLAKMAPLGFPTPTTSPSDGWIWRHIPGCDDSDWVDPRDSASPPSPISSAGSQSSVAKLRQFLDQDGAPIHVIPDRVLSKWGRLFDIVLPSSYTQLVERAGSILQTNEHLDTTCIFDEFLEAQANNNPSAMDILRPLGLRYFSPTELLRLFYFLRPASQDDFIWPEGLSAKTKYRLIGNSVNVFVVTELINFLYAEWA